MAQTRRRYTREFKIEAVRLLETSGKNASQIERELGINLWRWKRKFGSDSEQATSGPDGRTPELERIRELERENEMLHEVPVH
jgi:transposase